MLGKSAAWSFVPTTALDNIKKEGLMSGQALISRPDLIKLIALGRGVPEGRFKRKFIKDIEDKLKSHTPEASMGPNFVWRRPPPDLNFVSNHPIYKHKLTPIRVDIPKILKDIPETRIFGMELVPFDEAKKDDRSFSTKRKHDLSIEEINKYRRMSSKRLWSKYYDPENAGLYAPDVPHGAIITPTGKIDPKYLKFPKQAATYRFEGDVQGVGLRKTLHQLLDEVNMPGVAYNDAHANTAYANIGGTAYQRKKILNKLKSIADSVPGNKFNVYPHRKRDILHDVSLSDDDLRRMMQRQGMTEDVQLPSAALMKRVADRYRLRLDSDKLIGSVPTLAFKQLLGEEPIYNAQITDPDKFGGIRWPMKQAAKGIPDRKDYGDLSNINIGQLVDWIVQKHDAERAGTHYDVRFGTPESGLYSWAARKGLPKPGEKNLAVQQPLHSYDYKDFEGRIEQGYGKGNVKKQDSGEILLTDVSPNKINFTTGSKRFPERFSLVSTGKGKNWLLLNTTPTKSVGVDKVHYKVVDADKVQPLIDDLSKGSSVQAKIDGASSLINLVKDKVELLSYRQNKATGYPIFHTERAFGGIPKGVPKDLNDTILRGELYGLKDNKVIPPSELGGLLNSGVAKSLKDQKDRGIQLRNMVYDIAKYKGKEIDVNKIPYEQRMKYIKEILDKIPHGDRFEVAQEAKTPDEARSLLDSIRSGQHPQTSEGIVIHPPTGNPIKSKLIEEQDVHIREFFPGKGRLLDKGVGGFKYSLTPTGPILGEVGTGLSDDMRSQMYQDQGSFIGRRARVRSQGALPSGALRAPALISLHEDYPLIQGQ